MVRSSGFGSRRRFRFAWYAAGAIGAAIAGPALVPAAKAAEEGVPNLACVFDRGASWTYEGGAFNSTPSHPLSFKIRNVDLEEQTATLSLKPDVEGGTLTVVRAINANHFIEAVTEGFLNLTTVYDRDPKTGKHPAVHSRHFGLIGQPVFGQYTGFCTPE